MARAAPDLTGVSVSAPAGAARADARAKATGSLAYVADVRLKGMVHAALVRSPLPHARVGGIEVGAALACAGVIGVYSAADLPPGTWGRRVRDVPLLATGKVRFVGDPVAVVVATRREEAEAAAALVDVSYEELPAVFDPAAALEPGAPLLHDVAWSYPGSVVSEGDPGNLQSLVVEGPPGPVEAALAAAAHVVEATYTTPAGHQGYLEPQGCIARAGEDGTVEVWAANKSPYRLRTHVADCLGLDPARIVVNPLPLGGDFGGKGAPMGVPLCVALARIVGRPVRLVLRYSEDLAAANPRHPSRIKVRVGAGRDGLLVGLHVDALFDGGAYAGFKPVANVGLHGAEAAGSSYRIPAVRVESRIAYTNSVPKGHARAPGAPQVTFAVESALDELAGKVGISPVEMRRRNLLLPGEANPYGATWAEARGMEVLEAALGAMERRPVPAGWLHGWGLAVYDRATAMGQTSLRLVPLPGGLRAEVPFPETGTGNHTVVREALARLLGMERAGVEVVHVGTGQLPVDSGVGASRVTTTLSEAAERAAAAWAAREGPGPVEVRVDAAGVALTSYCVQVAQVAVDPGSGAVRVLEVLSAIDVAQVVHPAGHRMQVDGGAAMGYGFACLEDLEVEGGQVWAGNLGEFKLPSARDVPAWETVLVPGSIGVGVLDVKPVGELANVPTAAAIANAVAAATGVRLRDLPIRAESVYEALAARSAEVQAGQAP